MILLKILPIATLLTLAAGCRTSRIADSDGQSSWADRDGVGRTYTSGESSLAINHSSALSNDDTSRTYDISPALVADDMLLRGYNDDTSRTYHCSGATSIDGHGTLTGEVQKPRPSAPSGYYYSEPKPGNGSEASVKP